jgi:hypothetical protein
MVGEGTDYNVLAVVNVANDKNNKDWSISVPKEYFTEFLQAFSLVP